MKNSNGEDRGMNLVTHKRMKSSSSSSSSSDSSDQYEDQLLNGLSEGLLFEILLRVPSRALHRLKSVCKAWNALISSNHFVMSFNHFRYDPSLPQNPPHSHQDLYRLILRLNHRLSDHTLYGVVMLQRNGIPRRSTRASEYLAHQVLDLSFLPNAQSKIEVRASFADLLLCSLEERSKTQGSYTCFYVCNVLTKRWFALPHADHNSFHKSPEPIGFLCVHAPCPLCRDDPREECGGKDRSRYKFAVVRILVQNASEFEVQLYLSENGVWRNHVVSIPTKIEPKGMVLTSLFAYRGMLHWLNHNSILVYDPFNSPERLSRVISLPPQPQSPLSRRQNNDFWVVHSFGLQHGRDCLCVTLSPGRDDPGIYIWNLVDYDSGKWSLVHKIRAQNMIFYALGKSLENTSGFMKAKYIHIDGNAICTSNGSSHLWLCNTQKGTMTRLRNFDSDLYSPRLTVHLAVNQLWPTAVPPPLSM